jgi:hypothetical protein
MGGRIMRHPDWKSRLHAYLAECAQTPFGFGTHDCALFAAGAVAAMTGDDFAADYRGRYSTLKGGLRLLQKAGFADHITLAAYHFAKVHSAFVAPGDLAVIDTDDSAALGVVQGEGVYVLHVSGRIGVMPMDAARTLLKVP